MVPEFLMDKFEVTNIQYKAFVDAGGYTNPAYWTEPILVDGKEMVIDEAAKLFVDRTGRPGPAGWEGGIYPAGLENHPVTG
ncbi:MAG: SUMF1/EgtB/PvdO family nonheme iron enzyme, partial [Saprospiraceae bacterium]|nr:SUMF1/EgtB/PvdO family nonheme iron enzyme [Saprospiraceae bacterium]